MRIIWDARAVQDLREIRAFIAADKPAAAAHVAKHIKISVRRLSKFPSMGRHTTRPNIRKLSIPGTPFAVYYRLLADAVEILAVLHGARRRFPT
jgi:plasmid stabilization system protein ParE